MAQSYKNCDRATRLKSLGVFFCPCKVLCSIVITQHNVSHFLKVPLQKARPDNLPQALEKPLFTKQFKSVIVFCGKFTFVLCLSRCSFTAEKSETRQHRDSAWYHPHRPLPHSGLRIFGKTSYPLLNGSYLPLRTSVQLWPKASYIKNITSQMADICRSLVVKRYHEWSQWKMWMCVNVFLLKVFWFCRTAIWSST